MFPDLPWEIHPDLTRDRLVAIGRLITRGRSDAVMWQNTEIGDDNWVLGCRAFQAARYQIISTAETEGFEWLEVVDPSKHLIFKIGGVPVRFYRGLAEEPTTRTLRQTFPELEQLALVFPGDERQDLAFRFAVETDVDGTVAVMRFVGLLGENAVLNWPVPLEGAKVSVFPVAPPAEGVELAAPVVQIPSADADDALTG
jgi:hypothetical protein